MCSLEAEQVAAESPEVCVDLRIAVRSKSAPDTGLERLAADEEACPHSVGALGHV